MHCAGKKIREGDYLFMHAETLFFRQKAHNTLEMSENLRLVEC